MFVKAGVNILIYCDMETKKLRVGADTPVLPGYKGIFQEIAEYDAQEKWEASPYAKKITEENVRDMIAWFWIDLADKVFDSNTT